LTTITKVESQGVISKKNTNAGIPNKSKTITGINVHKSSNFNILLNLNNDFLNVNKIELKNVSIGLYNIYFKS